MVTKNLDTTVIGLYGLPIADTTPNAGQVLFFNGTYWIAADPTFGGGSAFGPSPPALPVDGDLWFNTDAQTLMIWNGVDWVPSYPDNDPFLQLAGGTMTGPLVLAGNATAPLQPVALQQLTSTLANYVTTTQLTSTLADYVTSEQLTDTLVDYATVAQLADYLPLSGGALTGPLELAGDATFPLGAVTLEQMEAAIAAIPPSGAGVVISDTMPTSPEEGLLWWDLVSVKLYLWDGSQWVVTVNTPDIPLNLPYLPLVGGKVTGLTTFSRPFTTGNPAVQVLDSAGNGLVQIGGAGVVASATALSILPTAGSGNLDSINLSAIDVNLADNLNVSGNAGITGNLTVNSNIVVIGAIAYPTFGASHYIGFSWNPPNLYAFVDGANAGQIQFVASDENLKNNIEPVEIDPLAIVEAIGLRQFDWKPTELVSTRPHYSCGYIAQDIKGLIPESVSVGPDGVLAVDLVPLVGYLIGAVQQLATRLTAVEGTA